MCIRDRPSLPMIEEAPTTPEAHPTAPAAMPDHSSHAFKPYLAGALMKPPAGPGMIGVVDHYAAIRIVGVGGMGVVVEAIEMESSQTVALKLLRPELRGDLSACLL